MLHSFLNPFFPGQASVSRQDACSKFFKQILPHTKIFVNKGYVYFSAISKRASFNLFFLRLNLLYFAPPGIAALSIRITDTDIIVCLFLQLLKRNRRLPSVQPLPDHACFERSVRAVLELDLFNLFPDRLVLSGRRFKFLPLYFNLPLFVSFHLSDRRSLADGDFFLLHRPTRKGLYSNYSRLP